MDSRTLIRWSLRHEQRREKARGKMSLGTKVFLVAALCTAEMSRRIFAGGDGALVSAAHLWLVGAIVGYALCVFGAPFRLYWNEDSKLLACLPLPGRSLWGLCLWRSHRAALAVSAVLFCALLPLALLGDWSMAARHGILLALGFVSAAWLGPATAAMAGAIVASETAQAAIASMGGEFQAPRTSWLGLLPGLSAALVVLTLIASSSWAISGRSATGTQWLALGLGFGVPVVAVIWATLAANQVIPRALKEVASLDEEILAHVERTKPTFVESRCFDYFLAPGATRLVATKDATISRRRYPAPYFVSAMGIVACWIVVLAEPHRYLSWALALYGGLLIYTVIMGRRLEEPPVELPAFLCTLPISQKEIRRAKAVHKVLRISMLFLFAGLPVIVSAPNQQLAGALVFGATVAASVAIYRQGSARNYRV